MRYTIEFEPADWLADPDHTERWAKACAGRAEWLFDRATGAQANIPWDNTWSTFEADMLYLTEELSCLIIKSHVIYDSVPYARKSVFFRGEMRSQTIEQLPYPIFGDWQLRQEITTRGNSEVQLP